MCASHINLFCNPLFYFILIYQNKGTMEGAQAVIGSPTLMTVEKYTLIGSSPRIRKMSTEKQTLLYTSITTQEEDSGEKTTVMEFAKYLNEEGENDIVVGGENTFICALGSSDELNYHSARDSFKVNIESPEVSTNTTGELPSSSFDKLCIYFFLKKHTCVIHIWTVDLMIFILIHSSFSRSRRSF